MRPSLLAPTLALGCALAVMTGGALAQAGDKNAERAARRLQLQMQAQQQQLQDAQAAKAKLEADKAAADTALALQTQLNSRSSAQLARAGAELKKATADRDQFAAQVQALEKQLAEQQRKGEETLAGQARESALGLRQREELQASLQRRLDEQIGQVAECNVKNVRLLQISAELLDRYRQRTVLDVVKQRDTLLGLGDVQMFNLVQAYRDKAEAERFLPSGGRGNNPP